MIAGTTEAMRVGAYGLWLSGIDEATALLVPACADWSPLEVIRDEGRADSEFEQVSAERARLLLRNGGMIELERTAGRASFLAPVTPQVTEVVHPYLAPVAAVMAFWDGRESFHAGGFSTGEGVWALLGDRGAGKSSTLAALAERGVGVACDDMLILKGGSVLAGPRIVDLRAASAERLGVGEPVGIVGDRERWRVPVEPIDSELPLRGFVFLAWGDNVEMTALPSSERVSRLLAHRGVRLPPPDPTALLELARLPGFELRRPRAWESLPAAIDCLLATIGG